MKVDLAAAAAQTSNATAGGGARALWVGGTIEIDETLFLDLVARAVANQMGRNLHAGIRPDGSGPMPARQYDGEPRGKGAKIALALAPKMTGPLTWFITAHQEKVGHLQRLMGEVPLAPPPIQAIRAQTKAAFDAALTLQQSMANVKGLRAGGASRAQLKAPRALVKQQRTALVDQLRASGVGGKNVLRSGFSRHVRRAARYGLSGKKLPTRGR